MNLFCKTLCLSCYVIVNYYLFCLGCTVTKHTATLNTQIGCDYCTMCQNQAECKFHAISEAIENSRQSTEAYAQVWTSVA